MNLQDYINKANLKYASYHKLVIEEAYYLDKLNRLAQLFYNKSYDDLLKGTTPHEEGQYKFIAEMGERYFKESYNMARHEWQEIRYK